MTPERHSEIEWLLAHGGTELQFREACADLLAEVDDRRFAIAREAVRSMAGLPVHEAEKIFGRMVLQQRFQAAGLGGEQ